MSDRLAPPPYSGPLQGRTLGRLLTRAITVAAVVLSMGLALPAVSATASSGPLKSCAGGIFTDTSRQGTIDPGSFRTIRRLRRVEIDFSRVFPGGALPSAAHVADSLTLNLFPDVCVIAEREQATDLAPRKVQWVGRLKSAPDGRAILVVDDTLMIGTVTIDHNVFQIRYLGDGVHAVVGVDQSAFPRD